MNPKEYTQPVSVESAHEYHEACLSMIKDRTARPIITGARNMPMKENAVRSASADTAARLVLSSSTSLILVVLVSSSGLVVMVSLLQAAFSTRFEPGLLPVVMLLCDRRTASCSCVHDIVRYQLLRTILNRNAFVI